jgi:hypothetical protein
MPREIQPFQRFLGFKGFLGLAAKALFDGPQLHHLKSSNHLPSQPVMSPATDGKSTLASTRRR